MVPRLLIDQENAPALPDDWASEEHQCKGRLGRPHTKGGKEGRQGRRQGRGEKRICPQE